MGSDEIKTTAENLSENVPTSAPEEPIKAEDAKAPEEIKEADDASSEEEKAAATAPEENNTAEDLEASSADEAPEEGNAETQNTEQESSQDAPAGEEEPPATEDGAPDSEESPVSEEENASSEEENESGVPESPEAESEDKKEEETSSEEDKKENPPKNEAPAEGDLAKEAEAAENAADSPDDEGSSSSGHRGILYTILGILIAALVFIVGQRYVLPHLKKAPESVKTTAQTTATPQTEEELGIATVSGNTTPETVRKAEPVTEAKRQTEKQTEEKKQTEKKTEAETQKKGSEVKRVVFGENKNSAGLATIKVTGLTDSDKSNTNFKESAFVKTVAAFLADNNITVNTISFFGKCQSSGRSFSYQARLGSDKDHILVVTMYPAIPGEYVYTLVPIKDIKSQYNISETKPQTASQPQTTAQPQTASQAQVQPQTTAPVVTQTPNETMPPTTDSYDASSFYVSNIPSTLSNYMNNADVLQYRLYDYLYQRGIRNVTGASVSGYDIDEDSRSVTIDLALNSGGSVRCYYDRDSNQYSFQ